MIVVFLLYNISAVRAFFNLKFEFKIDKLERGCYCLYTLSTEKRRILFEKETKQTTKVRKEAVQKICGEWLKIWNTGGADLQNETNIEAKRELEKQMQNGVGVYYTYVFKVDDYFSDKKMAEQIKDDLESAKTYSRNNKGFELVIIGTHRDKADKHESKIDVLANELSQKYGGKCKIWDLTRACEQGKQVQKELVEFITQA